MRALLAGLALGALPAPAAAQNVSRMLVTMGDRRIALDGAGYQRGNASADAWIVEFADFGCGYCEKFHRETLPVLDSLFVDRGRVLWKFVPFTIGMFPNSTPATEAAICAAEQGRFFPFHDLLYENRGAWMKAGDPERLLTGYATALKLDLARYTACRGGRKVKEQLAMNNALARSLYVRGTPTFFINGESVPGALPTDVFVQGMQAVLKAAAGKGGTR